MRWVGPKCVSAVANPRTDTGQARGTAPGSSHPFWCFKAQQCFGATLVWRREAQNGPSGADMWCWAAWDTKKCSFAADSHGPTAQKRLKSCLLSFTPVNNTQHTAPVALPQAVSLPGHYLAIQTRLGRC